MGSIQFFFIINIQQDLNIIITKTILMFILKSSHIFENSCSYPKTILTQHSFNTKYISLHGIKIKIVTIWKENIVYTFYKN